MKKSVITLITVGILFSCNNDDDSNSETELVGNWKLIEILADPGDGSGTFNSVESEKIITFESGGIITSNGALCDMSINTDNPTSGTYSISESTINPSDCIIDPIPNFIYRFEQNENILIISYPCIEPCKVKFIKE